MDNTWRGQPDRRDPRAEQDRREYDRFSSGWSHPPSRSVDPRRSSARGSRELSPSPRRGYARDSAPVVAPAKGKGKPVSTKVKGKSSQAPVKGKGGPSGWKGGQSWWTSSSGWVTGATFASSAWGADGSSTEVVTFQPMQHHERIGSWASRVLATLDPIGAITAFQAPMTIWIDPNAPPTSWLDICCRAITFVLMIYLIWTLAR